MRNPPLVLVVDDEEIFLEIVSMKLRGVGFQTETVGNALEATAKAEALQPDFVLADIYMASGPSGWDLALELHRNPKTRAIKIAFFTSLRDPWLGALQGDRQAVLAELGAVTVLSKSDDMESLGERISQLIHNTKGLT